jgi:hypothetical protein
MLNVPGTFLRLSTFNFFTSLITFDLLLFFVLTIKIMIDSLQFKILANFSTLSVFFAVIFFSIALESRGNRVEQQN